MTKSTPLSQLPTLIGDAHAHERKNQIPSLPLPVNTNIGNDINEDNDDTILEALSQLKNDGQMNNTQNIQINPGMNKQGNHFGGMPNQIPQGHLNDGQSAQGESYDQGNQGKGNIQGNSYIQGNQRIPVPQGPSNSQILPPHKGKYESPPHLSAATLQHAQGYENGNEMEEGEYEGYIDNSDLPSYSNESKKTKAATFIGQVVRGDELKKSLFVMLVFFIVTILPIENYTSKYTVLETFPFSNILVRTVLAGILYFALTHLFS